MSLLKMNSRPWALNDRTKDVFCGKSKNLSKSGCVSMRTGEQIVTKEDTERLDMWLLRVSQVQTYWRCLEGDPSPWFSQWDHERGCFQPTSVHVTLTTFYSYPMPSILDPFEWRRKLDRLMDLLGRGVLMAFLVIFFHKNSVQKHASLEKQIKSRFRNQSTEQVIFLTT